MGSSPPRGVFTSSPQNCSPGYNVSHYHCCHENRCKEDIGGDGDGDGAGYRDDNVSYQFESAWC